MQNYYDKTGFSGQKQIIQAENRIFEKDKII